MITRGLLSDTSNQVQIGDSVVPVPAGTSVKVTPNRKPSEDDAGDGPDLRSHELKNIEQNLTGQPAEEDDLLENLKTLKRIMPSLKAAGLV